MSCPSSGQQCNGLYPQTPQQTSGTVWPIQPCQPYWPCQPNQPTWPVSQPSTAVPMTWPVQPTQPGWPNTPTTPTSQPSPTVQPNPPVQPSWPAQLPTPPGYLPSPVPLTWNGNPGQPGCPGQVQPGGTQQPWPTAPVTVPFNMNFPRGIYDKLMLTIRGQVKPDAKMFTINFLRGNDIALHINPRFNEGGKSVLVRNHKLGERWGKEERDILAPFPFIPGHHFEMKILCSFNEFKVAVNNTPIFDFQHRIREVNQIDRIIIQHDVTLTSVTVDTLP